MPVLSELEVLIVDCQTTGATPALGAVLELGWCVVQASRPELDQAQAHWISLPDGHSVSSVVRRLTGFDERQPGNTIEPAEAWQWLRASMRGHSTMPAAIHFARFELAFLRDWARRFEPEAAFPLDAVCVHAIACRLYPDLPRRSLRALAGHLGHGLDLTRHALGHVEATAFVWRRASAELERRGVCTWEELRLWLAAPAVTRSRSKQRRYPIESARYRTLPDRPGVYRLLRANGDVLYVGKAASLRKRVTSHFASRSTREHAIEMLTQVSDIQVTVTPTALEAAVLENESIKALRPPYNQQLTAYADAAWFVAPDFARVASAPDALCRIGPLPSRFSLRALGALIALGSGEPRTRALTARALGTAERWAPDPALFDAGFAELARRHPGLGGGSSSQTRRSLLSAAKQLSLGGPALGSADEPADDELGPALDQPEPSPPAIWDPERIARHLERALAQAYQLLRRAAWLCLLHDSAVVYREPGSEQARLLVVRGGELALARELAAGETVLAPSPRVTLRKRHTTTEHVSFDRAKYDRLRVLLSELRRVRRDQGSVAVYVAPGRRLGERVLDGIFG